MNGTMTETKSAATKIKAGIGLALIALIYVISFMGENSEPLVFGIRAEFFLFALTLIGVALLHDNTFEVALTGLSSVIILKLLFLPDFHFFSHLVHEQQILINLFGLLLGFAILAKHFEESNVPEILPKFLPDGWTGGFILLIMVFVLSSFLDNIAAAMIGGTIALVVFKKKVHIGYIAGIVAASNAGGSGSVVGDTTTTMMWIDGVSPIDVTHAYYAAVPALVFFGIFASLQQHKYQPIQKDAPLGAKVKWEKIAVVALMLTGAILTNVYLDFPAVGVWAAILLGAIVTKTPWKEIPANLKGSIFLLSLVLTASMMPVDKLPPASVWTAFALGFVSAVFDNIPLTKLALDQGGYDWGVLAYSVGFGGSMIWFGSSAGVAISNMFHEAKSVGNWIKSGWHVTVAYIIGFFIMIAIGGWHPHAPHKDGDTSDAHGQIEVPLETPADVIQESATGSNTTDTTTIAPDQPVPASP